jgi:hypothetical protein
MKRVGAQNVTLSPKLVGCRSDSVTCGGFIICA